MEENYLKIKNQRNGWPECRLQFNDDGKTIFFDAVIDDHEVTAAYIDSQYNAVFENGAMGFQYKVRDEGDDEVELKDRLCIDPIKGIILSSNCGSYYYCRDKQGNMCRIFLTPTLQPYVYESGRYVVEIYCMQSKTFLLVASFYLDLLIDEEELLYPVRTLYPTMFPKFDIALYDYEFCKLRDEGDYTLGMLYNLYRRALNKGVEFIGECNPRCTRHEGNLSMTHYACGHFSMKLDGLCDINYTVDKIPPGEIKGGLCSFIKEVQKFADSVLIHDGEFHSRSDEQLKNAKLELHFLDTRWKQYHNHVRDALTQARVAKRPNKKQKVVTLGRQRKDLAWQFDIAIDIETKKPCGICFEDYKLGDWLARQVCGHVFHRDCIRKWTKKECPTCRIPCN